VNIEQACSDLEPTRVSPATTLTGWRSSIRGGVLRCSRNSRSPGPKRAFSPSAVPPDCACGYFYLTLNLLGCQEGVTLPTGRQAAGHPYENSILYGHVRESPLINGRSGLRPYGDSIPYGAGRRPARTFINRTRPAGKTVMAKRRSFRRCSLVRSILFFRSRLRSVETELRRAGNAEKKALSFPCFSLSP
jgi:hypothetical protein